LRPSMPPAAAVALGFLVGVVLVPILLRWFVLANTVFGLHGGDFLGPPKRRLLWTAPIVLLLNPLPYVIVAIIVLAVEFARDPRPVAGVWLALGFCLYAVLIAGTFLTRRLRKNRTGRGSGNS
jgi:hypothetical protein